ALRGLAAGLTGPTVAGRPCGECPPAPACSRRLLLDCAARPPGHLGARRADASRGRVQHLHLPRSSIPVRRCVAAPPAGVVVRLHREGPRAARMEPAMRKGTAAGTEPAGSPPETETGRRSVPFLRNLPASRIRPVWRWPSRTTWY